MTVEQEERLVVAVERCADALTVIASEQYTPEPEAPASSDCPHPHEAMVLTAGNPPKKWCSRCEQMVV